MFEAKAKLSTLCDEVAKSGEPLVITRRGKPLVRIVRIEHEQSEKSIWAMREAFVDSVGPIMEDFKLPKRPLEQPRDPLADDR